jgi:DNA-binding transcriptional ArsR family regulator
MAAFHLYRPQRSDPELLEKITVAREPLLRELLERLARWQPGNSRQHDLFIGPRGIGKSHLLRLTEHRLRTDPAVRDKWVPIRLAEEFYGASRVSDLLLEALRLLSEEDVAKKLAAVYEDIRYDDDDDRVRDRCLDAFRAFHRETGRAVLLMIENLDRLLERQVRRKTEVHRLRRILMEEDWIVVFCTSPTYLNAISQPEEPFFEFFRIHSLAEMTPEEQQEMMRRLAATEQKPELDAYLKKYRSRLRALYHFTGGNPRLTVMLYDLVAHFQLDDVRSELDLLLDQLTPFYQDRMKEISEQEAKVLETMSLLPEGATPTELAREARLDAKSVRATMTRLERAGYVRREERRKKKTVYIVPERLFRIWHQMNHSRAACGRVQYLLEFFASWYATKEDRDHVWSELAAEFD